MFAAVSLPDCLNKFAAAERRRPGGGRRDQPHNRIAKETRAVTDLVKHWMSEAQTSHLCKLDLALLEQVNNLPYE